MSVTYGGYTIDAVESLNASEKPHTVKQTIGKKLVELDVSTNSTDTVIEISGVLTATSASGLKTERNNLDGVNDGAKHAYVDSTDTDYNDDYVVATNSLKWSRQISPLAIRFSIRLIEW